MKDNVNFVIIIKDKGYIKKLNDNFMKSKTFIRFINFCVKKVV